ncbi:MAG: NUDIX hydrolase [Planctomycetota bacterium]|nr:NUDIX hydrolase [Planctomycetota bacterium]
MSAGSERRVLHRGKKFDLEMVSFRGRSGETVEREVVRHGGAACILPLLPAEEGGGVARIVMVRVFRVSLGAEHLELPAGTMDKGEEPARCAARELEEETGYRAGELVSLGWFHTTPGMTDERMHAFVARGLEYKGQDLEEDEALAVAEIEVPKVLGMLDRGEITDGKTIATLALALRRGLLPVEGVGRGGAR